MCGHEPYMIDLLGLAQGHTLLSMRLDDAFFEAEDQTEILGGDVSVGLDIERCGEVFIVTIFVSSKADGTYQIQQLKIDRQTAVY